MKKKQDRPPPSIKGYLPIRIALPPIDDKDRSFSTFIYVKEHVKKSSSGGKLSKNSHDGTDSGTLFVANAPANGPIRTDLFLRALFERFGEVARVTVAQDPRKVGSGLSGDEEVETLETFREAALSSQDEFHLGWSRGRKGDGKFAHVVFGSGKELKRALKAVKREISGGWSRDGPEFSISLDGDTIERLTKESKNDGKTGDDDSDAEDSNAENEPDNDLTGILAVAAEARRKAGRHMSRQKLMEMCNDAMASFETEEAEAERKAKMAAEQPDEDGFITVTHGSTPSFGATNDFEEERFGHQRKTGKRNRKRKAGSGAAELTDFYRFQLKETRKKEVQDLKKRFEEDLAKVKKMKEERAYRPF